MSSTTRAFVTLLALALYAPANGAFGQNTSQASIVDGGALYAKLCAICHGGQGEGYVVEGAPALGNQDFLAVASDEFIFAAIARGRPGTKMSPWSAQLEGPLDDQQIQALVNFIRSRQTVPSVNVDDVPILGSPRTGMQVFQARCTVCHGEDGEGNSAPSLNNSEFLAAASDGFIRYAVAYGRRGTPMASYATELTWREIDDLVALIRTWEK
jgi:cbb3-type cytochrome c oxidase subunit III